LRVLIPLAAWMLVSFEYCVLSHKELIPRLEDSYRLCMYPCARSGETITPTPTSGEKEVGISKRERKKEESFIV
jgi:hypothetical protein